MEDREDELRKEARTALTPFVAAALRSASIAELAAGGGDDRLTVEVSYAEARRALVAYETKLGGEDLARLVEDGREHRRRVRLQDSSAARWVLEVAAADGTRRSESCETLESLQAAIGEAAAAAADELRGYLGAAANGNGDELGTRLARQAYRRLTATLSSRPHEPAAFPLPERAWLQLRRERD